MRLKPDKTWSQQQVSIGLRVLPQQRVSFLSFERRRLLVYAAKTALAASLSWYIARSLGLHDGYWGSISAIIVLQSNMGATVTASRDRLLGTLIGAFFGFAFSSFGMLPWNFFLAIFAAVIVCGWLGLRSSSRLAGVTISILMLVQAKDSHWYIAVHRVIEVLLGILVALAVTTWVLPDRARQRLREGLVQEFLVLGAFFDAILQGFRGHPVENLEQLHQDALAMLRGNSQLLAAARNEPSGGPGWREGLTTLSQFGRSLFDALVALEFSVRDVHEFGYAQQLEPSLGNLVKDTCTGFHNLAGRVRDWQFHHAPSVNLEEDIAQLEIQMTAARPMGIEYSQAEILCAYAVQLHLKQIARLLRSARMETGHAVGETKDVQEECCE